MNLADPATTHLVLVGGGHAHVTVIKSLGMRPEPGVVVTVVSKDIEAPYSGMLPGFVAGHYTYEECHIDLVRLATWAGMRVVHGTVTGIDRGTRRIEIEGRAPLGYDLLSIDVGITPKLEAIKGADEHGIAVKPVSTFAARWREFEDRAMTAAGPRRIVVVGAGAAGFELVLAARHRLRTISAGRGVDARGFELTLIGGSSLLPSHNARARDLARRALERQGVTLLENSRVSEISASEIVLDNGRTIAADAVLLATNAGPAKWFETSGLPLDQRGFIAVRPTLQLTDDDDVFAVGDCSTVLEHPREKAGVFAVRQGPPLTENLRRRARNEIATPFVPQTGFLTLLSTGGQHAIAARNGLAMSGGWVWRWKDRIDREFMDKFNVLPPMPGQAGRDPAEIRCAGCAAKVGPLTLARALTRLNGTVALDDTAVIDEGGATFGLETIDFFRAFWPEPYTFGEIAAVHAMSDVFAMGGRPSRALANVVLPFAHPNVTAEDLFQVLAGAKAAFDRDGVALVGGHSGEGQELAAGFSVTGTAERAGLLRKSGLKAGDALVVTKPLGSGILFAGLMRGLAHGRDISKALDVMRRSNADAARILAAHGAKAATDVTGFGLAGHLVEMIEASKASAVVDVGQVPLMDGALGLAREGVASSLLPENLGLGSKIEGAAARDAIVRAILFDPQTSGGLIAGVPEMKAGAAVEALRAAGMRDARVIGRVTEGSGRLTLNGQWGAENG